MTVIGEIFKELYENAVIDVNLTLKSKFNAPRVFWSLIIFYKFICESHFSDRFILQGWKE